MADSDKKKTSMENGDDERGQILIGYVNRLWDIESDMVDDDLGSKYISAVKKIIATMDAEVAGLFSSEADELNSGIPE